MSDANTVLESVREHGAKAVGFRFTDLDGRLRQLAVQAPRVDETLLHEGVLIDGSSIPGWRDVSEADMLLRPDLASAFLDPFTAQPQLVLLCNVSEPATGVGYERCPRAVAERAASHLRESGIADEVRLAIELGFFVFDEVRTRQGPRDATISLDSPEAPAGGGRPAADRPDPRGGYLAVAPADQHADLRQEIATVLESLGVPGVSHHHGQTPGQCGLAFGKGGLLATADRVQVVKHVVRNVAASYGKTATFMPRPQDEGEGSGLFVHQSLWREGRPLFAGTGYADLSETCLHYVGGILHHARALNAFTNPTTNSYRRLAPAVAAPALLAYAAHNRSAAVSIPYAQRDAGKRLEVRFPDPSANPYLALAALVMAGLDGIERRLDPGEAMDRNLYDLPPEEMDDISIVCRDLHAALAALEADHDFLTKGEVMSAELIAAYVGLKRAEADRLARAPHPLEFDLYYGV